MEIPDRKPFFTVRNLCKSFHWTVTMMKGRGKQDGWNRAVGREVRREI